MGEPDVGRYGIALVPVDLLLFLADLADQLLDTGQVFCFRLLSLLSYVPPWVTGIRPRS